MMEFTGLNPVRIMRKCITVHHNGDFTQGKVLYVQPEWEMDALLNAVSQRLDLLPPARRLFNADGMDITDVLMIEDGAIVFVSAGQDFVTPSHMLGGMLSFRDGGYSASEGEEDDGDRKGSGGHPDGPVSPARTSGSGKGNPNIPSIVGGYIIGDLLGRGGFGEVRLGQHQLTGERVAMKFLQKSSIISSMGAAERTTTEIQSLMTLNHPNVIRLLQQFENSKYMVMVFELMAGGDLFKYLCSLPGNCMSEDEARVIFHQIVSAVSYAHNHHICHRDLKLENVLLAQEGSTHVKIADFGLSDFYPPGATRRSQCGSFAYLAPEVFKGTSNAGPPIDAWALGVILFSTLCGRLPFDATGSRLGKFRRRKGDLAEEEVIIRHKIVKCQYKLDDSLSPEAKDLIRRMLKLDPNERASIPEITTHCWLRQRHAGMFDMAHPSSSNVEARGGAPRGHAAHSEKGDNQSEGSLRTTPLSSKSTPPDPPSLPLASPAPSVKDPSPLRDRDSLTSTMMAHDAATPLIAEPIISPRHGFISPLPDKPMPPPLEHGGSSGGGLGLGMGTAMGLNGLSTTTNSTSVSPAGSSTGGGGGPTTPHPVVPLMLDAPLLTSPLHARQRRGDGGVTVVSFLDQGRGGDDQLIQIQQVQMLQSSIAPPRTDALSPPGGGQGGARGGSVNSMGNSSSSLLPKPHSASAMIQRGQSENSPRDRHEKLLSPTGSSSSLLGRSGGSRQAPSAVPWASQASSTPPPGSSSSGSSGGGGNSGGSRGRFSSRPAGPTGSGMVKDELCLTGGEGGRSSRREREKSEAAGEELLVEATLRSPSGGGGSRGSGSSLLPPVAPVSPSSQRAFTQSSAAGKDDGAERRWGHSSKDSAAAAALFLESVGDDDNRSIGGRQQRLAPLGGGASHRPGSGE